jgi:hypothetical protein
MSLLRSKATRVFYSDNGTLSDKTEELRTWGTPNFTFSFVAAEDAIYIGRPHAFNHLYVAIATANSGGGSMTVQYWNGDAWASFTDLVDETAAFNASGFLQWEPLRLEWQREETQYITGLTSLTFEKQLYWVKITLSANSSANTSLRAVSKLLSDDRLFSSLYPEITNYYPSGQTDFLPQHELAKDAIVTDLINQGVIDYEDQIKSPDDLMLAATYRCAQMILEPIPGDERLGEVKKAMAKNAKDTLRTSSLSLDKNQNESLDVDEEDPGASGQMATR